MSDDNTLFVGMLDGENDKCIKCLACVKGCPTKIDPRSNPHNACINCEKCIDNCEKVLKRKGGKSILGLRWGYNNKFTIFRANVIITLTITFALFIFTIISIISKPLDINVTNINGSTFDLVIKNNTNDNIIIRLKADKNVTFEPNIFSLKAKGKINEKVKYISNLNEFIITFKTNNEIQEDLKILRHK